MYASNARDHSLAMEKAIWKDQTYQHIFDKIKRIEQRIKDDKLRIQAIKDYLRLYESRTRNPSAETTSSGSLWWRKQAGTPTASRPKFCLA